MVVRLEWVLQLLNTSGLTWVAVLLPRSKIPKLKSESVSRRPWYGGIYSRLCNESYPRHGEAVNEPGMRVCCLTPCRVGRDQRLESFSTWDSSPRSKETLSFKLLKFPFDTFSEHWAAARFTGLQTCRWFIQWPRNNGWNEMSEVPRFWAAVHWSSSGKGRRLVLSWLRLTTGGEKTATAGTGMRLHLLQAPPAGIPLSTFG